MIMSKKYEKLIDKGFFLEMCGECGSQKHQIFCCGSARKREGKGLESIQNSSITYVSAYSTLNYHFSSIGDSRSVTEDHAGLNQFIFIVLANPDSYHSGR